MGFTGRGFPDNEECPVLKSSKYVEVPGSRTNCWEILLLVLLAVGRLSFAAVKAAPTVRRPSV